MVLASEPVGGRSRVTELHCLSIFTEGYHFVCSTQQKLTFQQVIMHVLQYPHDVDVHFVFCFDLDLHLTCFCFVHVHQHAQPRIAGAGRPCYDRSLLYSSGRLANTFLL